MPNSNATFPTGSSGDYFPGKETAERLKEHLKRHFLEKSRDKRPDRRIQRDLDAVNELLLHLAKNLDGEEEKARKKETGNRNFSSYNADTTYRKREWKVEDTYEGGDGYKPDLVQETGSHDALLSLFENHAIDKVRDLPGYSKLQEACKEKGVKVEINSAGVGIQWDKPYEAPRAPSQHPAVP